jgi:hypothetical protein
MLLFLNLPEFKAYLKSSTGSPEEMFTLAEVKKNVAAKKEDPDFIFISLLLSSLYSDYLLINI